MTILLGLSVKKLVSGLEEKGGPRKANLTEQQILKIDRDVSEALSHLSCMVTPRTAHYLNPVWGEFFSALHAVTRASPQHALEVMNFVGRLVSDVGLSSPVVLEEAMSFAKELEQAGEGASLVASLSIFPKVRGILLL